MIRVRREDGSLVDLPPDAAFIELCDIEGGIAQLMYTDGENKVNVVRKGDSEAEAYQRLFPDEKLNFIEIVKI